MTGPRWSQSRRLMSPRLMGGGPASGQLFSLGRRLVETRLTSVLALGVPSVLSGSGRFRCLLRRWSHRDKPRVTGPRPTHGSLADAERISVLTPDDQQRRVTVVDDLQPAQVRMFHESERLSVLRHLRPLLKTGEVHLPASLALDTMRDAKKGMSRGTLPPGITAPGGSRSWRSSSPLGRFRQSGLVPRDT